MKAGRPRRTCVLFASEIRRWITPPYLGVTIQDKISTGSKKLSTEIADLSPGPKNNTLKHLKTQQKTPNPVGLGVI